ncbi:MAG: ABC transporter substrate-binding protein [Candidatus Rokubacteria bacterium]|nr:ABC transporter substrate-binding protein [Candidatus Rokubacteria bacterium]
MRVASGVAGLPLVSSASRWVEVAPAAAAAGEVVIGAVVGLTGITAQWGKGAAETMQLAVNEINAAGGVKSLGGARLKLVVEDHESKPDIGAARTEKLAQQKVQVLTGCVTSSVAVTAASIAERLRVPFVDGGDSSPQIVQRGFKYVFMLRPTAIQLARKSVDFSKWAGQKTGVMPTKVAIIVQDDTAGTQIGENALARAKEVGFNVVDYVRYSAATARDFSAPLTSCKQAGVDTIFHHGKPADTVIFVKDMKSLDFNPNYIGILGGAVDRTAVDNLKQDAEYMLGGTDFNPEAKVAADLVKRFKTATGREMDTVAGIGYWTIGVIWGAVEAAASTDRDKIRDAIRNLRLNPGERYWVLPTPLQFNDQGLNIGADVIITQVRGGKHRPVYPESIKTVELVWPRPRWSRG